MCKLGLHSSGDPLKNRVKCTSELSSLKSGGWGIYLLTLIPYLLRITSGRAYLFLRSGSGDIFGLKEPSEAEKQEPLPLVLEVGQVIVQGAAHHAYAEMSSGLRGCDTEHANR